MLCTEHYLIQFTQGEFKCTRVRRHVDLLNRHISKMLYLDQMFDCHRYFTKSKYMFYWNNMQGNFFKVKTFTFCLLCYSDKFRIHVYICILKASTHKMAHKYGPPLILEYLSILEHEWSSTERSKLFSPQMHIWHWKV